MTDEPRTSERPDGAHRAENSEFRGHGLSLVMAALLSRDIDAGNEPRQFGNVRGHSKPGFFGIANWTW